MPSFDLATGYVTFKGDFSKFEADIQKAQKKVEGLNNSFKGKQFEMAAHAAMSVNKQLELAQKNAKRMMDEIRYGKMGLMFRDAGVMLQRFQQRMQAFGAVGVGVGAAAVGAASVASPLAADTLQGSVKLLTATIGRDFVPMVMQLSFALQDAARWWKQLDPAIKSATAETVKMVAVAGGAALALAGVGKVLSFIAAHPLVSAAGAGLGLGALIGSDMKDKREKGIEQANSNLANMDRASTITDGRMQELRNMTKQEGLKAARSDFEREWKRYDDAKKGFETFTKNPVYQGIDWLRGGKGQAQAIDAVTHRAAEFEKTKLRWQELAGNKTANLARAVVTGAGIGGGEFSKEEYKLGKMGPSSYSSLQDYYRAFNVEATSGSSIDAEILNIQTKTLTEIQTMNRTLETKLGKAQ